MNTVERVSVLLFAIILIVFIVYQCKQGNIYRPKVVFWIALGVEISLAVYMLILAASC